MTDPNDYQEIVSQILRPTIYSSLRDTNFSVEIHFHENPSDPNEVTNELVFDDLYPFYTVGDLMMKIYMEQGKSLKFHPQNQCLLVAQTDEDLEQGFSHFQYVFPDNTQQPVVLINPFERVKGDEVDSVFVYPSGLSTNIETHSREHCLLETTLLQEQKEVYYIHCFSYLDMYKAFTGVKPVSRLNWEGKFRPYFPHFPKDVEATGGLTGEITTFTEEQEERFIQMDEIVKRMDDLVQTKKLITPGNSGQGDPVSLSNFRNIRIGWKPPTYSPSDYEQFRLETLFFDTHVNEFIPYIRLYSSKESPLSKVYVVGPTNIPGVEDPDVLLQWAQETTIMPGEDVLMMKCLVRPTQGNTPPLYGTVLFFNTGHAQLILQPNADMKSLSIQYDLGNLANVLQKLSSTLPKIQPKPNVQAPLLDILSPYNTSLQETYVVFSLNLDRNEKKITQGSIQSVMPFFRPFFQSALSPLIEQHPLAFLRYKLVDNFRTPSRDFQYLKRIDDLQKLKGASNVPMMVELYKEEFNVSQSTAAARVREFIERYTEVQKINPDPVNLDFVQTENPGMDISIFGKHPSYTFHVYRIDSLSALQRIKTLLALLISVDKKDFNGAKTNSLEDEEEEDEQDAEVEAQQTIQQAEQEAEEDTGAEGVGFYGDLGALVDFDEEENEEEDETTPVKTKGKANKGKKEKDETIFITDISQLKHMSAKSYFLNRLYFYDRSLFYWNDTHPGFKQYASRCQASDMKQPIAMREQEYKNMREIYAEDEAKGFVQFIDYPLTTGQVIPPKPNKDTEVITTLRYGTNLEAGRANIYLCCELWCREDNLPILKKDFIAEEDREKNRKLKNTCPFCKGGLVDLTKKKSVVTGETVIQRSIKKGSKGNRHEFVGFLTAKNIHPNGYGVPCCFIKEQKHIYDTDPFFTPKTKAKGFLTKKPKALADKVAQAEEDETGPTTRVMVPVEDEEEDNKGEEESTEFICGLKIQDMRKPYIVGAEKFPLEIKKQEPQVGILPAPVERFFAQSAFPNLVRQDHAVWKIITDNTTLKPSVSGFFRIAVDNSKANHADSFFAAIAPYFMRNSASQVKEMLRDKIPPKRFIALNYGNFLFDFYSPTTKMPLDSQLEQWTKKHFQLQVSIGDQKEALRRIYKAYEYFTYTLTSKTIRKEYRQYAHFFAQENVLPRGDRTNGLLFIVLEVDGDSVTIRCPPYGISQHMMDTCDIAFIAYYPKYQIWEPIFYTLNKPKENIHEFIFSFPREKQAQWPLIVQQRVEEFFNMCKSSGLGVYTDVPGISSDMLIPVSQIKTIPGIQVFGLMRDLNNHISNILVYSEENEVITIPVIDDGILYDDVHPVFDWNDVYRNVAPADVVREFYETKLSTITNTNPKWKDAYTIERLIRIDNNATLEDPTVYTYLLGGGLYIPVEKPAKGSEVAEELGKASELPWMIDRETVYAELQPSIEETIDSKEFEEIYQHLRYTFSNWLAIEAASFIGEITDMVFNNAIPLFEKRRALYMRLEPEIKNWLVATREYNQRKPSIKRIDCRIQRKGECTDRCIWSDATGCALHVPEKTTLGTETVNAVPYMIRQLIEELIRFPRKRDEMLFQKISQYQKLHEAIRIGNEYIVPEHLPAWTELLRMDWRIQQPEAPKHLDELVMLQPTSTAQVAQPTATTAKPKVTMLQVEAGTKPTRKAQPTTQPSTIPKDLQKFLSSKASLQFIPAPHVMAILCELGLNLFEFVETFDVREDIPLLQTMDQAEYVAKELQRSIYQIGFETDNPVPKNLLVVRGNSPSGPEKQAPFIVLIQSPDGQIGALSSDPKQVVALKRSELPPTFFIPGRVKNARNVQLGVTQKPVVTQQPVVIPPFHFPSAAEMAILQNKKFAKACPFTKDDLEAIHKVVASPIVQKQPGPTGKPYAIFMCGPSGSGKSTLIEKITAEKKITHYIRADPDMALPALAWDSAKKGTCRTVATAMLTDLLIPKYFETHHHMVLDFTCRDSYTLQMLLKNAKKEGYVCVLVEIYVSLDTAKRRVKERETKTGRVVPEDAVEYIYKTFSDKAREYTEASKYPFDEIYLYNNNEEKKEPLLLLMKDKTNPGTCPDSGDFYFDYKSQCKK